MIAATWLLALAAQSPPAPPHAAATPVSASAELAIELPDGPVRDAWERRAALPATAPAPVPHAQGAAPDDAWSRWAELVEQRRSDELALLAAEQRRWDDAWRHWVASADARGGLGLLAARRTLAPLLLGHALDARGDGVADGAVLRPALPPQPPGPPGTYQRCRSAVRGLRVGAATLDLELSLELDGVQIDVTHVGGGACRVAIALPTMPQFALAQIYADWEERAAVADAPIELAIQPGDERHTLWGRFEPRANPWPARVPERMPDAIARKGIELLCDAADPRRAELAQFGAALGRLTGARVALRDASEPALRGAEAGAFGAGAGLVIDLRVGAGLDGGARDLKWLALVSLAERYWLAAHPQ